VNVLDLYLDADACPVKEDAYRVAERYGLRVFVVANREIFVPKNPRIALVVASGGFDAVDDWIATHVGRKDIVVTNDLLLANRCIGRDAFVLDPRGRILNRDNIGEALAMRELLSELRLRGAIGLGPPKMGKRHKSNFRAALDEVVQAARRE
jgi:uncharacterized protein YaiI (UPF0178 family)